MDLNELPYIFIFIIVLYRTLKKTLHIVVCHTVCNLIDKSNVHNIMKFNGSIVYQNKNSKNVLHFCKYKNHISSIYLYFCLYIYSFSLFQYVLIHMYIHNTYVHNYVPVAE